MAGLLPSAFRRHRKNVREFEKLATPLMDQLYFTALKMTKNQFDAEDLLQDTYLKAWRFFHQFERGTNFRGWIYRILTTTYINRYNKRKREPARGDFEVVQSTVPEPESEKLRQHDDSAFTENYDDLFDDTVTAALDNLPEYYRLVILLSDVADLSYKEIAAIIDSPIGTVMSRLSRGRKLLAEALQQYAQAGGYLSGKSTEPTIAQ